MYKQLTLFLLIPFLLFYAFPISAVEKEEKAWQDETVYYIEVDRFNNGNPHNDGADFDPSDPLKYHGGDLQGIIKKLDYISEMGFSTIVLSSIYQATDVAGEQITDFKKVDEHYGTIDDVKMLVEEAHKRKINVLLKFVANHVGEQHPFVSDSSKQTWFHEELVMANTKDEENLQKGWHNQLPDLATEIPETRDYLVDVAKWWTKEGNIDGFYFEYIDMVDKGFWKQFIGELNREYSHLYYIGSLLNNSKEEINSYLSLGFTSILNESFYMAATEVFPNANQSLSNILGTVDELDQASTYVDRADTSRFTSKAAENNQHPGIRLKMALSYMYTTPGTPFIYYGTEIALNGGAPPDNKQLMNYQSDEELIDYIGKLAKVRKSLPSLRNGEFTILYEEAGMTIYKRTYKDETVIVALNNTTSTQSIKIPAKDIAQNKELRGLIIGDIFQEENGAYEFILDRETAEVYELSEKSGLNIPFIAVFIIVPLGFIAFLVIAYRKGKKTDTKN
ncbi:alpha-amylase family glycosyl hydrolase [Metabacillus malikii]|uniref:Alpha-amylase n=1 Tax=Metabacillus malikii TaxID=1504265 RepID=A0ABT9ZJ32_9BACI|nr:alpha-amylase family glycosyl hydrolase [Metabacillus malikii]MDQ0232268.1 alpha-amylase [Metabacillus malikii]